MSSGIVNTVLHVTYKENVTDENPILDLEMLPEKFFQKITILKKHFQKIKNFQEFVIKAEVFLDIAKEIHEFLSKSPELSRHQKFNYCMIERHFMKQYLRASALKIL